MQIDIIDNFETFKERRENWDSVYAADPQAQFFLSWVWLSGWLQMVHEPWFILAAKPDTHDLSYVAFFPLKIVLEQQNGGGFYTQLYMAGNSMADYTGLICLPGYEEEVIPAFAAYIQQQLVWSTFNVQNILETDTRMSLFLRNFSKAYDFLKGNEEYKYSFGAKERRIQHIVAKYKDCQNRQLDVRIIPLALQLTVQDHRANRLTEAEQGYRQILEAQSNHPEALYGLGVLMRQKGEYQTAENLLRSLLQVQPNSIKALFSLGNLYQAQGQLSRAIEAYNQVLALQPQAIAVYNNLGYALHQQGHVEDAIACYQKALSLQPDCVEAEVNLANALYAQGKLSLDKQAHYAAMNNDLGFKCRQAGDLKTAIAYYQHSICMKPDLAEAHYNLDLVLQEQTEDETASTCDQKTLIRA